MMEQGSLLDSLHSSLSPLTATQAASQHLHDSLGASEQQEGVHLHEQGLGIRQLLSSPPTQTILRFCDLQAKLAESWRAVPSLQQIASMLSTPRDQ